MRGYRWTVTWYPVGGGSIVSLLGSIGGIKAIITDDELKALRVRLQKICGKPVAVRRIVTTQFGVIRGKAFQ